MAFLLALTAFQPIAARGAYQGYIKIAVGLGAGSGAGIGSLIVDTLGWHWALGIQLPFLAVHLVFASVITPSTLRAPFAMRLNQSTWQRLAKLDILGGLLVFIATESIVTSGR